MRLTPQDPNNGRFLAVGLTNCAICEESLGRPEEAIRLRKRAVDVWKTTVRDHPALPSLRLSLVAAYGSLVHSLATQGRVVEAGMLLARVSSRSSVFRETAQRTCSHWPRRGPGARNGTSGTSRRGRPR